MSQMLLLSGRNPRASKTHTYPWLNHLLSHPSSPKSSAISSITKAMFLGVTSGLTLHKRAKTPLTWGAAKEVPEPGDHQKGHGKNVGSKIGTSAPGAATSNLLLYCKKWAWFLLKSIAPTLPHYHMSYEARYSGLGSPPLPLAAPMRTP
jgi:hypothetical protein